MLKIRNMIQLSIALSFVGGFLVITGLALYRYYSQKSNNQRENNATVQRNEIKDGLKKTNSHLLELKNNEDIDTLDYDGFGFCLVLNIKNSIQNQGNRRKFILDSGDNLEENRVSMYLDKGNNLVFRIIDNNSETHSIQVPSKLTTFQKGSSFFLFGEYIIKDDHSLMKLFINDKNIGEKKFDYFIDIDFKTEQEEFTLGADLEGNNGANFLVSMLMTFKSAISDKKKKAVLNAIMTYLESVENTPNIKTLEVDEDGYLKIEK